MVTYLFCSGPVSGKYIDPDCETHKYVDREHWRILQSNKPRNEQHRTNTTFSGPSTRTRPVLHSETEGAQDVARRASSPTVKK